MSEKLLVPQLNPNDSEVELTHWYVKHGQAVKKGDLLCDFTTSKAVVQHESPGGGFVAIMAPAMKRMRAGTLMGLLCATEMEAKEAKAKATEGIETKAPVFSNAAKAKLAELGLKESDFSGHDFVTEKMVSSHSAGAKSGTRSLVKDAEISALQMAHSALRSSLSVQLDADELQKRLDKKELNREGFLAWCVCQALREHPRFLLGYGRDEKNPPMKIAYALDMGAGVRPMLAKDAGGWTAEKWAEQIVDWSLRLMRNEVKLEELHDGNGGFTITDLSSQGVLFFEPLLVGSQSAILGIGGDLEANNPLITFTLAFDHRVHDGRTAAAFLKTLKAIALLGGSGP